MAQGISSGETGGERFEKLTPHIVVDSVKVREREMIVDVPFVVFDEVRYEKPVIVETKIDITRYVTKEIQTVKYVPVEKATTVYKPIEVVFEKPTFKEVVYEKPIIKEVEYEKPKIVEKEIEVVSIKDIALVKDLVAGVKDLSLQLVDLKQELDALRKYKLIEKEVIVPKLQWEIVKAERIEWIDVRRERPDADTNN